MNKKLWGGRFKKKVDPFFDAFSSSVSYDYRLAKCDLIGSFLHIHTLREASLITRVEFSSLKKGILSCLKEVESGKFAYDFSSEDIHTNIQNNLFKKAGSAVEKLQTSRSRNEQVVFATKLYCLISEVRLQDMIDNLAESFDYLASKNPGLIIPGYTHLQHAQPVYFKDYLSAYKAMFLRDSGRLESFSFQLGISVGCGALAGTPIDKKVYQAGIKKALKALKMEAVSCKISPTESSLSDVSDRDFIIEFLSILATMGMHISRLCEDFILWSTKEFSFIELADEFSTGSSLMPQKKNPDSLELMRGSVGKLYGNLVSVLTTMKGLPLSYNRDMQLDKEPLFSSVELMEDELVILADVIKTVKVNKESIFSQLKDESLFATDIADYLVSLGVSFKKAHEITGKLISYSLESGIQIKDMSQSKLDSFSKKLSKKEVLKRLDPYFSVASKKSLNRR